MSKTKLAITVASIPVGGAIIVALIGLIPSCSKNSRPTSQTTITTHGANSPAVNQSGSGNQSVVAGNSSIVNQVGDVTFNQTTTSITQGEPDYIEGTKFTHNQLRESFPFGHVVLFKNGDTITYRVKPSDHMDIRADWESVKLATDFANRMPAYSSPTNQVIPSGWAHWEIPQVQMIYKGQTNLTAGVIAIDVPIIVGGISLVGVVFRNQPSIYLTTLSDDQRRPVFAVGFKIPPPQPKRPQTQSVPP